MRSFSLLTILVAGVAACHPATGHRELDEKISEEDLSDSHDFHLDTLEQDAPDVAGTDAPTDNGDLADGACCCMCPDGSSLKLATPDSCLPLEQPDEKCDGSCLDLCPVWDLPSCSSIALPSFAACLAPDDDLVFAYRTEPVLFVGIVESTGEGPADKGCREHPFAIKLGTNWSSADSYWFNIRDPLGKSWVVEVAVAGAIRPTEGDSLAVEAYLNQAPFNPTVGKIFLWRTGGQPLVWLAEAARVGEVSKPAEFDLSSGARDCLESSKCGSWVGYNLTVWHPGPLTSVPYGGTADIGDFTLFHGGVDLQSSDGTTCPDWFVARSRIAAIWRVSAGDRN